MGLDITKSTRAATVAGLAAAAVAAAPAATVLLTPAIYGRYVRQGVLYEKGVPYRFTQEQADILMEEVEEGTDRPLWKRYTAPVVAQEILQAAQAASQPRAVDMTNTAVAELAATEETGSGEAKRIEIGDDDELQELLGPDGSADAGVTV